MKNEFSFSKSPFLKAFTLVIFEHAIINLYNLRLRSQRICNLFFPLRIQCSIYKMASKRTRIIIHDMSFPACQQDSKNIAFSNIWFIAFFYCVSSYQWTRWKIWVSPFHPVIDVSNAGDDQQHSVLQCVGHYPHLYAENVIFFNFETVCSP